MWEIGDFVVQVPWDCFPVPDCVSGGNQTYLYAHHGGLVKVLPRMMPNEDSWIKESVRADALWVYLPLPFIFPFSMLSVIRVVSGVNEPSL